MPRLLISHFESELIIGLHKPDNRSDVKDGPPLEMVCRVLLNGIPVSSPHAGALNSDSLSFLGLSCQKDTENYSYH